MDEIKKGQIHKIYLEDPERIKVELDELQAIKYPDAAYKIFVKTSSESEWRETLYYRCTKCDSRDLSSIIKGAKQNVAFCLGQHNKTWHAQDFDQIYMLYVLWSKYLYIFDP